MAAPDRAVDLLPLGIISGIGADIFDECFNIFCFCLSPSLCCETRLRETEGYSGRFCNLIFRHTVAALHCCFQV